MQMDLDFLINIIILFWGHLQIRFFFCQTESPLAERSAKRKNKWAYNDRIMQQDK